jgi:hypothetical protein
VFDVPGFRYRSPENGKKRDDAALGRKGSLDVGKMKANRKPPFSSLRSAAEKRRRPGGRRCDWFSAHEAWEVSDELGQLETGRRNLRSEDWERLAIWQPGKHSLSFFMLS